MAGDRPNNSHPHAKLNHFDVRRARYSHYPSDIDLKSMRILAIGDIHGCATALDTLLATVKPQPADTIVTLGDYVDRGPNSKGVLDRLISLHETGRLVALRGNHELMMLYAVFSSQNESYWRIYGGAETLDSYSDYGTGQLTDIPAAHWHFIKNICRDYWESDLHFFVHANADPQKPLH